MAKVLFLQTCDGVRMKPMLDIAEPVHRAYCARHGYEYMRWDGIKHGSEPYMATYNRIPLLMDLFLSRKDIEWVFFVDADALVVDGSKPLDEFLDANYAMVACRGASDADWNTFDVNIGVALYHMKHPKTKALLCTYQNLFQQHIIPHLKHEKLANFDAFRLPFFDDQVLLQEILKTDSGLCKVLKGPQYDSFNYDGPFVKQVLRTGKNTIGDRTEEMARKVAGLVQHA